MRRTAGRPGIVVFCAVMIAAIAGPHPGAAGCAPVALNLPLSKTPRAGASGAGSSASVWPVAAADDMVEISFLGHASFEIVSSAGIRAVTDYNGINGPADPPDIATMNHAHARHYTLTPNPRIRHVLHGWWCIMGQRQLAGPLLNSPKSPSSE